MNLEETPRHETLPVVTDIWAELVRQAETEAALRAWKRGEVSLSGQGVAGRLSEERLELEA